MIDPSIPPYKQTAVERFSMFLFSFSPCPHPAWSCASSLHSFQSFYPQHDSVMYLPGSAVIETWPSFFSFLPSLGIALDSHRPPPRPFIQLRAFWGFKCEVLGASSNCLGTGCLAVGTVTVGSPKWANAHEWGFNIFCYYICSGAADWASGYISQQSTHLS